MICEGSHNNLRLRLPFRLRPNLSFYTMVNIKQDDDDDEHEDEDELLKFQIP